MFVDTPPDCSLHPEPRGGAWDAAYVRQLEDAWECQRLERAIWSPIEKVAREGREVRRVSLRDGRLAYRIPGVALERERSGRVTIKMSSTGPIGTHSAVVPDSVWREVTAQDALSRPPPPGAPDPVVSGHCDSATIEAASGRKSWRREVHACVQRGEQSAMTYAYRLAGIAMDYLPVCAKAKAAVLARRDKYMTPEEAPMQMLIECGAQFAPQMLPMN